MELSVLSSGSSGNCFFIENKGRSILVDAGISCKQIVERMNIIGKFPERIEAIFVTHEHSDHIKGIDVFARTFNVPIFATKKTAESGFLCSNEKLINYISNKETIKVAGLSIEAFSKSHKASDPVSFNINNSKRISIITDAGFCCPNIISSVKDSDFLCLESNHDELMLEEGPYPYFLKKWIKSDIGHLSNMQASLCVLEHAPAKMKGLVLSHLSETNNTPKIALKSFNLLKERSDLHPKIFVSQRDVPTKIFNVR